MTSACIFKNTLRNDTRVFLKFKLSVFDIFYLFNFSFTPFSITSLTLSRNAGTKRKSRLMKTELSFPATPITFCSQFILFSCCDRQNNSSFFVFKSLKMASNISINSIDSDVFYVEQSSNDPILPRPNTPIVLNSTEMSGNDAREKISISSIASPGQQIVTFDSDSNEPTMPYGLGRQLLSCHQAWTNLQPNPFNVQATMLVVNATEDRHGENYSPHSAEPPEPSPISTPPMKLSTVEELETPPLTTTDNNTFYSDDEPRRIDFFYHQALPHRHHPESGKKLSFGISFLEQRGESQHVCEAWGPLFPEWKDLPRSSSRN